MIRLRVPLLLVAAAILANGLTTAQAPSAREYVLNVSKDQLPTDTGLDDKTKFEIVELKELGGKALKVPYAAGDSIGIRPGPAKNWKRFAFLRFDAFNPGQAVVGLEMVIQHARSTNYQTRVAIPIKLKPGKNEVKIGIDELANVNGSAPDLAQVNRWYISDVDKKGPLVYLGDIWLEGGQATGPATGPAASSGPAPLVGYKIKGKVGDLAVDLTITPFYAGEPPVTTKPAAAVVRGDPARLTRLRALKLPKIDKVIEFHTPEADAICAALEVFPENNPWNLVVEDWPLHPNSKAIVATVGNEKSLRYNDDMSFIVVPPEQKKIDVKLVAYAAESDKGPYPVPDNVPIEGWPSNYLRRKTQVTLDDVQRDKLKEDGDRHAIVLDPANRMLYEFYQMKKTDAGWQAACAAIFDLKSNKLRPDGWTSTDAAGLPIYPAVVRHDELVRGEIEHALRVTVRRTQRAYVYPATHFASKLTDQDLPRMGERFRLRKDFDISGFSPQVQTILKALKKYGMLVADNGIEWAISVAPDPRIPVLHDELRKLKGSDFEVVTPPPGYVPAE